MRRTSSSFSTFITPYTRSAAFLASRFSWKLPTVPRSVTVPSAADGDGLRVDLGIPVELLVDRGLELLVRHSRSFRYGSSRHADRRGRRVGAIGAGTESLRETRGSPFAPRRQARSSVATTFSAPANGIPSSAPTTPPSSAPRDAQRDRQRRELHRAVVDELLQRVVLDLLVEHQHHDDDHRLGHALRQRDRGGDDRADRRADHRDEVEDRDEQAQRNGIRDRVASSATVAVVPATTLIRRLPAT